MPDIATADWSWINAAASIANVQPERAGGRGSKITWQT